jgi:hypothetical protein
MSCKHIQVIVCTWQLSYMTRNYSPAPSVGAISIYLISRNTTGSSWSADKAFALHEQLHLTGSTTKLLRYRRWWHHPVLPPVRLDLGVPRVPHQRISRMMIQKKIKIQKMLHSRTLSWDHTGSSASEESLPDDVDLPCIHRAESMELRSQRFIRLKLPNESRHGLRIDTTYTENKHQLCLRNDSAWCQATSQLSLAPNLPPGHWDTPRFERRELHGANAVVLVFFLV